MQPWLLASGFAIGGALLGALACSLLHRRWLGRDVARATALLDQDNLPASPGGALAPVLTGAARQLGLVRARLHESESQRRQLSADMVQLMNQSDGAVRAKDRFLAAANHDLRQPLQALDLALEQLRRDGVQAQQPGLSRMEASIRTMTEALDGLLLLSQLDAGALQANAASCSLHPLFAELREAQAASAREAGVELHMQANGHAVFTDAGMLGGLLGRLLDNAIRATPRGGRVMLAARVRGPSIRIEVRDSGIGIAPVHQPRVFDEFFQLGNPERDHRKGFGLGLSIVSRLAGLLGTRVELRSALHRGSCFWLDLPRASVMQRPASVLLLDSDAGGRDALAAMLASWGFAVHAESALEDAKARLAPGEPPVEAVLCAVDSHEDPSLDLLQAARDRRGQAVRIVLYADPSRELLEATARHGAQALGRPPAPAKLRALLARRPHAVERGAA